MTKNRVRATNLEMNQEVFKLRRKVIDLIYHIKTYYPDHAQEQCENAYPNCIIDGVFLSKAH